MKMTWDKLLATKRHGETKPHATHPDCRSEYESDIDRIIFSSSFRRLSKKTQVHPFCQKDHVHTRLTHSLEVAQVGYSLGKTLGSKIENELPTGITGLDLATVVRAACLAHDLGNPPFGHAGEEAVSYWFEGQGLEHLKGLSPQHRRDICSCEGNAQGFRMLTQTENHLFRGGLRLTYATLGAFMKYPWSSRTVSDRQKFGAFLSEEKILAQVAKETGLVRKKKNLWCRHPLAYLSEAADDICYAVLDLEDAVEMGVLDFKVASNLLLSALPEDIRKDVSGRMLDDRSFRVNFARIRGPLFDALIGAAIEAFMGKYTSIMNGSLKQKDLFATLKKDDPRTHVISEAKRIGRDSIYTEQFKTEVELGCFATFDSLLSAFCTAAVECAEHVESPDDETALSWKSVLVLRQLGNHAPKKGNAPPRQKWSKYLCLRRVLDYVTGMTDNYARNLARQLAGDTPHS